jgi:septal ring-binding cell division protein DamX
MAKDFAAQPNGKFTVQFEIVCETASVTKALRDGGSNVWFTSMSFRGKPCFRVFWGRYDTRDAASAAVAQLPASLRGGGASVVAIPR